MIKEKKQMEILIASVLGIIFGAGGAVLATQKATPSEPIIIKSNEGTEKAIQQLTALDITKPVCTPEYIEKHTDLLCRELTCLQFTRGFDAQTSGDQCESIANIQNTIMIDLHCKKEHKEPAQKQDCIDLFFKRK